jgi:hypothetical protein
MQSNEVAPGERLSGTGLQVPLDAYRDGLVLERHHRKQLHGPCRSVEGTLPALCAVSRVAMSDVRPVYVLFGFARLGRKWTNRLGGVGMRGPCAIQTPHGSPRLGERFEAEDAESHGLNCRIDGLDGCRNCDTLRWRFRSMSRGGSLPGGLPPEARRAGVLDGRRAKGGGEGGIRTLSAPLKSVSYRFYNADDAVNARVAVAPCTLLHAGARRQARTLSPTVARSVRS